MSKIKAYVSREPVRVYLYGIVAAICAALVVFGVIAASVVPVVLAVVAAVLVVPSPVEALRSQVIPAKSPAALIPKGA